MKEYIFPVYSILLLISFHIAVNAQRQQPIVAEAKRITGMNAIYPDNILLTPNQEAIFQKDQQKFQKKILEKPVIIDPGVSQQSMTYEETPVIKALEQFKKAYGISTIYDEDSLRTCTITGDLTDELLYSRLN